jgi:hypothetical protein
MDETQYSQLAGLLGIDPEKLRQQQQMQGLLSAGLNILAASGPSAQPRSLGQIIGQGGMAGMQAYQEAGQRAIDVGVQGLKIAEIKKKFEDERRLRDLGGRLMQPEKAQVPTTDAEAQEGGFYGQPGVNVLPTRMAMNQSVVQQLMTTPGGMEYLKNFATTRRELAGKTEVVEIFSPRGTAMKVRYNVDTGEYTPIGGEKAEPFVQIDRGNVIELRRPSGDVIGTLTKGSAPVAPSFTMTDFGVLNTKTGQVQAPTDAQGNPIAIDPSIKASEDERKSAGFYTRMRESTSIINGPLLDAQGKPITKNGRTITIAEAGSRPELFAEIVGGIVPNWAGGQAAQNFATSPVRQQYENAQQNWVRANLRAESGAAIGVDEMKKEIETYFPQVGDSKEKIEQKAKLRESTENAMKTRAGRAISTQKRNITVDF